VRSSALLRLQAVSVPLLLRGLRRLPPAVVSEVLGLGALVWACFEPRHARRVFAWMRGLARGRRAAVRLGLALLQNRGRFLAIAAWPSQMGPDELGRRTVLEGREYLEAARCHGGLILVGFHLGPQVDRHVLHVAGYSTTTLVGRFRFHGFPRAGVGWEAVVARATFIDAAAGGPAARAAALHRARLALRSGAIVRISGDGEAGETLLRLPVGGEVVRVRAGWWALRRQTGAPTLPVLTHRAGTRVVVRIYPPLPPPVADTEDDLAACRETLRPLIEDHVRRFPDQCLELFRHPPDCQTSVLAMAPAAAPRPVGG
jgi:lauroyl/myristoyl acyltransferase